MKIQTLLPKHKTLQKHIDYYYFLQTHEQDFFTAYYAFPHTHTPLSIFQHGSYQMTHEGVSIIHQTNTPPLTVLIGMFTTPFRVTLQGPINEITIVFKPLGLNNFIKYSFAEAAGENVQIFSGWNQLSYIPFLQDLYTIPDMEGKVDYLERFLLSHYAPFQEQALLEKALVLLTDFQTNYTVDMIAQQVCLSAKTFTRLFYKHVGITPIRFRKIARFRYSLDLKKDKAIGKHLTQIALESNFFDQSYFIRMYHQLTEHTPSAFFNSIKQVADDKFIVLPIT